MKKIVKNWKKILLVLLLVVILIVGLVLIMMHVNKNTFEEKMSQKEFILTNTTDKFEKEKSIIKAYEAVEKDKKYTINFLEFISNTSATKYFTKEKDKYYKTKEPGSAVNYSAHNDKEVFSIATPKNRYIYLSRHNSTIVYYDIDIQYSEEVINILNELGY